MMARKKRMLILILSILILIIGIVGVLGFLYLETDVFKSNETLFAKYFMQNFSSLENLNDSNSTEIEKTLDVNKYVSEIIGRIEYTENISTSDENKSNPVNNVNLNIKSFIDKANNYYYNDVSLVQDEEKLFGIESLTENEVNGSRLDGIKQFVYSKNENIEDINENGNKINFNNLFKDIDLNELIEFTDEEIQTLKNTYYFGIIQANIPKNRYHKQSNSLITVNNQDMHTNAYYIKLTFEEYNNIYIKILKQAINDEIILSKIDMLEEIIKEKYKLNQEKETLRESFINYINEVIKKIEDKNIGQEEVKITVYESNMQVVRTTIDTSTNKFSFDIYNDKKSFKISNIELGETENEQVLKIETSKNGNENNILIDIQNISDSELMIDCQLVLKSKMENNKINKNTIIQITNEKYDGILNIEEKINFVDEFQNNVTLGEEDVDLDELNEEQINSIMNILSQNFMTQVERLNSKVELTNYVEMLQNLNILNLNSIEISNTNKVTETEKNRFNSQFEFFKSENLSSDNIKELLTVLENNFSDMKVILKTGEIEDLDSELLGKYNEEAGEYNKNISEIAIAIKQNSKNEQKSEDILKYLEVNSDSKFNVSIDYNNENGLAKIIRIKIQGNED